MAEHLFIRFHHFFGNIGRINIFWRQADKLLLAFAEQQLHRPVAAGKFFVFIAVVNQIRRGIEKRAQQRRLLFQLNLRLLAARHLFTQLGDHQQAGVLRLDAIADFLIELADIALQLFVQFLIALAHLFQLGHQPGQPLARLLQLLHHHGQEVNRPGRDQ